MDFPVILLVVDEDVRNPHVFKEFVAECSGRVDQTRQTLVLPRLTKEERHFVVLKLTLYITIYIKSEKGEGGGVVEGW